MPSRVRGYVTDVPYVRSFIRELAPAWLDHVALLQGWAPPVRKRGFAWCDLGCGQGVTAAVLAATHPEGNFYGIDAMPAHIAHARRLAAEAGISNVRFHAADFSSAVELDLPGFDYIVAHGVYSWVDPAARDALRRFIDRHLKPGGLVYVSYNAMPGRAADLPFQRLMQALGGSLPGDSIARVAAAAEIVDSLGALKAPALVASPMAKMVKKRTERHAPAYLAHELLGASWEPLCVTEVRAAMAAIGLSPVGSATLIENYDSFVLGKAARKALAAIADPDARELTRDFLIDQFFRRDVFARKAKRLGEDACRRCLLASAFSLTRPAAMIAYKLSTPAGRLRFDNVATRHIVAVLAGGPRRLADIAARGVTERDLLAAALALSAAGVLSPVEGGRADCAKLNRIICRRLGGLEEIRYLVLPCGTAIAVDRAVLTQLESGKPSKGGKFASWRNFLAAHGV